VSDHPQLNLGLFSFRGENVVEQFVKDLLACQDDIRKHFAIRTAHLLVHSIGAWEPWIS
jgi:hypothetical protein